MNWIDKLSVRQLRLLREIDRVGTWTDAGVNVGMAQSTVSAAIARIEALAGVPLFEADGVRRVPTRAGVRLIDAATQALPLLDAASEALEPGAESGVLRVGVIDAVPLYLARDRVGAVAATIAIFLGRIAGNVYLIPFCVKVIEKASR